MSCTHFYTHMQVNKLFFEQNHMQAASKLTSLRDLSESVDRTMQTMRGGGVIHSREGVSTDVVSAAQLMRRKGCFLFLAS